MVPFFEEHEIRLLRVLTDRGTEYCGKREHHDYQLYLALEDIDHSKTKTKSPQTNGICERFHKTILEEFYQIAFRKKICRTVEELQSDLDGWLRHYNNDRPHSGRYCYGKTPQQTFHETLHIAREKILPVALPSSEPAVGRSPHSERSEPGRPTAGGDEGNAVAFVGEV